MEYPSIFEHDRLHEFPFGLITMRQGGGMRR
jgi:hypothetical protein